MRRRRTLGIALALWALALTPIEALPERKGYVSDYANVLSSATIAELEPLLTAYAEERGVAIYVLIVPNLEGLSVEAYDERLTRTWALGRRHVLLLVAMEEAVVRLSTGAGVRRLFPDERIDPVLNETIIPAFARGAFDRGVREGIKRLLGLAPPTADRALWRRPALWLLGGALALALAAFLLH